MLTNDFTFATVVKHRLDDASPHHIYKGEKKVMGDG
jgi:hypothetical protein